MTDQEIRIAIAEACGFTGIEEYHLNDADGITGFRNGESQPVEIPDYPNDLNAMREARRLINTIDLRVKYLNTLRNVASRNQTLFKTKHGTGIVSDYDMLDASSEQHAEAFLKTIGKWNDT